MWGKEELGRALSLQSQALFLIVIDRRADEWEGPGLRGPLSEESLLTAGHGIPIPMAKQTLTLSLDNNAVAAIRSKKRKAIHAAIERTLLSEDRESSALAGFLQGFCTNTRESYVHESLSVDCVEDETNTRGTLSVSFMGDSYMGCKNADYQHDRSEVLKYRVDCAASELHLTGEFPEERSSLDEF